jgi:hypothetical protein
MDGHAIRDFAQKRLLLIEDLAFAIINFVRRYGVFINSIRHSGRRRPSAPQYWYPQPEAPAKPGDAPSRRGLVS